MIKIKIGLICQEPNREEKVKLKLMASGDFAEVQVYKPEECIKAFEECEAVFLDITKWIDPKFLEVTKRIDSYLQECEDNGKDPTHFIVLDTKSYVLAITGKEDRLSITRYGLVLYYMEQVEDWLHRLLVEKIF